MGMGYQGFCKFYSTGGTPPTGDQVALATGASVNLVLEPIYSDAVWGAGWYNAARAHYADAAIRFEGTVEIELQLGANGALWDFVQDWVVDSRAYPKSLDISPDGARVYHYWTSGAYKTAYDLYGAWNMSCGLSTSVGSFVTASLGTVALNRTETDPIGGTNFSSFSYINQKTGVIGADCGILSSTNPLNPSGNNMDPIPFWRTNAQLLRGTYGAPFDASGSVPQAGTQTVEWSIDITQNHVILYTCSGSRLPTAFLQGPIDATGSVILYNPDGVFDPILGPTLGGTLTTPYLYAQNTWFRVTITHQTGAVYIEIPAAVVESDDYSIAGLEAVTNRTFSIKGLGGRCSGTRTLPPCVFSNHLGALPAL